jgi:hypothetical protein
MRKYDMNTFTRTTRLLVAAVAITCASVSHAQNATVKNDVVAAETAYANVDFAGCKTTSDRVLAGKGLTNAQLIRVTRVSAMCNAALDKSDAAKEAFIRLLTYDPSFQLDSKVGPRYQDPFLEARGFWKAQVQKPGLDVVANVQAGALGALRVTRRDPTGIVARVVAGYRWAPSRDYVLTTLSGDEGQVDIAAGPKTSLRLDYFAQAYDAKDNVVFEEGNSDSPKTAIATVAPAGRAESKSVFASPWFWVIGGAVLAGGGVGTYLAVRNSQPGTPTGVRVIGLTSCGGASCN